MKKILAVLLAALLMLSFASCITKESDKEDPKDGETTVTTTAKDTTGSDTSDSGTSSGNDDETTSGTATTEPPATNPPTTNPPTTNPPTTNPPQTKPQTTNPPATTPPVTDPPVISYTVTFNVDGAKYHSSVSTNGSPITFPNDPKKEGHTFKGWYYDAAFGKPFTAESLKQSPLTSNITVYGKYELTKYTATFYADDEFVDSIEFVYTDETLGSLPDIPEKVGFLGYWESFTLSASDISVNAVYAESITVKVIIDNERAVTAEGETTQVLTYDDPDFAPIKLISNIGYRLDHYTVNGKRYDGDTVTLTELSAEPTIHVYTKYFTNELPIINIDTNDAPILNKEDYVDMVFDIENCEDELSGVTGGIRLRGNSTLGYPKKPYRIKFDKKQSLFGLTKAKSWVLLAEYIDPSQLHNHAALTLGNQMPGLAFTPSPYKVNVYLNGVYQGMYTLCEQVQENEGRMNIELDEITEGMTFSDYNWFVCLDSNLKKEAGQVLNETYIEIPYTNKYATSLCFEIKYPEKDAFPSEEQFNQFVSDLREYLVALVNDFDTRNVANIKAKVNMNSLIDYVIIDEIMGQEDHDKWHKSLNIYYTHTSSNADENGKVSFGPIWDYDWSLHTPWTNKPNVYYGVNNKIEYFGPFFDVVFEVGDFYYTLITRYKTYAKPALKNYINNLFSVTSSMDDSYAEDAKLWYEGTNLPSDITSSNINFLYNFLLYRENLLSQVWR